jgi:uncharacterized membrane protein (UPF0127 family)
MKRVEIAIKGRRLQIGICDREGSRSRGYLLRRRPLQDEGLLFIFPRTGIIETSIHMFLVFTPLGCLWFDEEGRVVEKVVARPFHPYYAPRSPARYLLEGPPEVVEWVEMGEQLDVPRWVPA